MSDRGLSRRELEVLRLVVAGATNKEIAAQLCITAKTVEARMAQACAKLGARSRTDAAVRAVWTGLVTPSIGWESVLTPDAPAPPHQAAGLRTAREFPTRF